MIEGFLISFITGQVHIDEMYLMVFNVLFTGVPPLISGILDQDLSPPTLFSHSYIYKLGQTDSFYRVGNSEPEGQYRVQFLLGGSFSQGSQRNFFFLFCSLAIFGWQSVMLYGSPSLCISFRISLTPTPISAFGS